MAATAGIPVPEAMMMSGNLSVNWETFREGYEDYLIATKSDKEDPQVQISILRTVMGVECRKVLKQLMTREQCTSAKAVLDTLQNYFKPERNSLYERYEFSKAEQLPGESIDTFQIRLRHMAEGCKFQIKAPVPIDPNDDTKGTVEAKLDYTDTMIRDRIVFGTTETSARKRLFREKEVTLGRAVETIRTSERAEEELKKMGHESEVHAVRRKPKPKYESREQNKPTKEHYVPNVIKCKFCLKTHKRNKFACPAWGKKCIACGKLNHFKMSEVCNVATSKNVNQAKQCRESSSDDSSDSDVYSVEKICATSVKAKKKKSSRFMVPVKYNTGNKTHVSRTQLDTGANCCAMGYNNLQEITGMSEVKLGKPAGKIRLYDGTVVKPLGTYPLEISACNGETFTLVFDILPSAPWPVIDGDTCVDKGWITLNLLKAVCSVEQVNSSIEKPELHQDKIIAAYQDVFSGLGCLPGKYHIDIDPEVVPVQEAPRRFSVVKKPVMKKLLAELETDGIITKVTKPTPWISSWILVEKDKKPGKVRGCLDPRNLNKAIRRPKLQSPTLSEITPRLCNAKVFSVLDAKQGFNQIELDEESSYLTTFWTPFGRYRYLRMPFGISSGPEEYQRRQQEVLEGLDNVAVVADDILVFGCGESLEAANRSHDEALSQVLERCRTHNLKLNKKKLQLRKAEVCYMGEVLSAEGLKADPSKIQAILDMPVPKDKKALQSFLGCVNYLAKFLPRLSKVSEPLRKLTEKDIEFSWEFQQSKAFEEILQLVTQSPVLKYYNVQEPVTLQCDASSYGLGAALLQKGQPIAFASRTLTKAEQNYCQIEKECLAVLFGATRFEQYLLGRPVAVESDHKPLEVIFKKPLLSAPKRLQRMLLQLQKFELQLAYKKGSEMYLADFLSRAPVTKGHTVKDEEFEIFATQLVKIDQSKGLKISGVKLEDLKAQTKDDEDMQELMDIIQGGWPDSKHEVPVALRDYFGYREELCTQDGLVFRGPKVLIPYVMRRQIISSLHKNHQGAEAAYRRAKDVLYWPRLRQEIKETCERCEHCTAYMSKQCKEPMMSHELPTLPWQYVAQDLFCYEKKNYLITVDYYSDFMEVDELRDTTSEAVIACTKKHFARYGIPQKCLTDGGPQFVSESYHQFTQEWGFTHESSSPYHAQGNGKAESAVKIAKNILKKGGDLQLALLDYRNTPGVLVESSPVQRLMNRRTRTMLPTTDALLIPEAVDPTLVYDQMEMKRRMAKKYYDRGARSLPELHIGEPVRVLDKKGFGKHKWVKGQCLDKVGPRSFLVETSDGIYRRNRKWLRPDPYQQTDVSERDTQMEPVSTQEDSELEQETLPKDTSHQVTAESQERDDIAQENRQEPVKTRFGRVVKKPDRLGL